MADTSHHIAERPFEHPLPYRKVYYGFFLSIIYTGEFRLLALLIHHLNLFHQLCGNILAGKLRIIEEKGFAVYGYLADCLTIGSNASVIGNFYTRQFLQKILQNIIFGGLERRSIILDGIFLYYNRIANIGNLSGLQLLSIRLHLQNS